MKFAYSIHGPKRSRRTKIIELFIIFLILTVTAAVVWWIYIWVSRPDNNSTLSQETLIENRHELKTFTTEHFTFQTEMNWQDVPAESTPQKYVYRAFNSTLVEQDLVIYVNPTGQPVEVTRIQPVAIVNDRLQPIGGVSEHCRKAGTPDNKNNENVNFLKVQLLCDNDGTIFSVLVGAENGNGIMSLKRDDGSTQRVTIIYRDLTATPVARDLKTIVSSFRSI